MLFHVSALFSLPNKHKSSDSSAGAMNSLGSNLSELDRLLLELNAVQQSTPAFATEGTIMREHFSLWNAPSCFSEGMSMSPSNYGTSVSVVLHNGVILSTVFCYCFSVCTSHYVCILDLSRICIHLFSLCRRGSCSTAAWQQHCPPRTGEWSLHCR